MTVIVLQNNIKSRFMSYLFSSESVSEGHPDKVADQISDAILDEFLRQDPYSHVACETLVTTGLVVVSGEVESKAFVNLHDIVRTTIDKIGYNKSEYQFDAQCCGIINALHEQSPDILRGVKREGRHKTLCLSCSLAKHHALITGSHFIMIITS